MGFLIGDGGAIVFILFAGFALGVVFGWSLLEGRWSGGGGEGVTVAAPVQVGEPIVQARVTEKAAGLAEVIPLRPTGGAVETAAECAADSSAGKPSRG